MQAARIYTPSANAFKSSFLSARPARLAAVQGQGMSRRKMVVKSHYVAGMGLLGTKAGMMSYFTPEGLCVPATVIAFEEGNIVTQIKTKDTDGYNAVQVGYKVVAERKVTKPELGHLKKTDAPPLRHLKEWRFKDQKAVEGYTLNQQLDIAEVFKEGDMVDVAGTSVGKGFQGTIKRWNHARGLMTHGSKSHRQHGSIGAATTPARVLPGLKMAGHMGNERVTVKRQQVLKIDKARNAIVIKGCVPGKPGGLVELHQAKIVGKNC